MTVNPLVVTHVDSPIGEITLTGDGTALSGLYMAAHAHHVDGAFYDDGAFGTARTQLREYFAGERTDFQLDLDEHGTEFQRRVWAALREIPYGTTASYGQLAARIGNPAAVRAVGLANGRNPISIVTPCHRVIGADGSLTGYGGGLPAKRWLLDHERTATSMQPTLL